MRHAFAAAAVVGFLVTGVAHAQLKADVQPVPPPTKPVPSTLTPVAQPSLESARRITREEAIKLVKQNKAVYVDVRPRDQYDIGHIKGAINIPLSELLSSFRYLPPKKFLITYCA